MHWRWYFREMINAEASYDDVAIRGVMTYHALCKVFYTRPPLTRRVTGAAPAWSRRMEPHCMSPTCGAKDVRRAQSTCESLDRNCVLLRGPVCGVALMGATGSWLLALVVRHAQQKDARYPRFPNTWECPARAPVSNCVRHYAEQPLAHSLARRW